MEVTYLVHCNGARREIKRAGAVPRRFRCLCECRADHTRVTNCGDIDSVSVVVGLNSIQVIGASGAGVALTKLNVCH